MLIPHRSRTENTYLVKCANWECVRNADNPEEAATQAFEEALSKYEKSTEISPIFTVLDLTSCIESLEIDNNIHFVYAPKVLANADMHDTSAQFEYIIDNLRNKIS